MRRTIRLAMQLDKSVQSDHSNQLALGHEKKRLGMTHSMEDMNPKFWKVLGNLHVHHVHHVGLLVDHHSLILDPSLEEQQQKIKQRLKLKR